MIALLCLRLEAASRIEKLLPKWGKVCFIWKQPKEITFTASKHYFFFSLSFLFVFKFATHLIPNCMKCLCISWYYSHNECHTMWQEAMEIFKDWNDFSRRIHILERRKKQKIVFQRLALMYIENDVLNWGARHMLIYYITLANIVCVKFSISVYSSIDKMVWELH